MVNIRAKINNEQININAQSHSEDKHTVEVSVNCDYKFYISGELTDYDVYEMRDKILGRISNQLAEKFYQQMNNLKLEE